MKNRTIWIAALLAACAIPSQSMPLRTGDVWTWSVRDMQSYAVSEVTASILDSSLVDSGTLWKIESRNDAGLVDTSILFSDGRGYQEWVRRSGILAIETTPFDSTKDGGRIDDSVTATRWGECFCSITSINNPSSTTFSNRNGVLECSASYWKGTDLGGFTIATVSATYPFPSGTWSDSLGLLRFRTYGTKEWILRRRNSDTIPDSLSRARSATLPEIGSSATWMLQQDAIRTVTTTTAYSWGAIEAAARVAIPISGYTNLTETSTSHWSSLLTWTIEGCSADTGDWVELTISESLHHRSIQKLYQANRTSTTSGSTSWSNDSLPVGLADTTNRFHARMNTSTGQILTLSERLAPEFTPERGWFDNWDDLHNGECSYIESHTPGNGIRKCRGIVDSLWSNAIPQGGIQRASYTVAAPPNSGITRAWLTGGVIAVEERPAQHHGSISLRELAARYPSTPVIWRNALGQQGRIDAGSLLRSRSQAGNGRRFVILDASFPNGSRWTGAYPLGL